MRTRISWMLPLVCSPLAFWGCSDDTTLTKANSDAEVGAGLNIIAETFDDLAVCSDKREGATAYVKDEKTAYICEDGKWVEDDEDSEDEYSSSGKTGDTSSSFKYEYDGKPKAWREATLVEGKLGGCTDSIAEGLAKNMVKANGTYYICKSNQWQIAAEIEYDTYGKKCTGAEVGSMISGMVTETNKYYCTANGWVSLMGWSWDVPKKAHLNPNIKYGTMTDKRDGQKYRTVTIGTQTWMAENLNYADSVKTPSLKGKSWCYGDDPKKCATTGRLYSWAAAIDSVALANDADNSPTCGHGKSHRTKCKNTFDDDNLPTCGHDKSHRTKCETTVDADNPQICGNGKDCDRLTADALAANPIQGVCPCGWHLPSRAEWETLFTAVGGASSAGVALKTSSGWYKYGDKSGNGTDAYGFSALPAAEIDFNGNSYNVGRVTHFWSATQYEHSGLSAYDMYLNVGDKGDFLFSLKYFGYSVRCIKNE